jgi:hypothetical protein
MRTVGFMRRCSAAARLAASAAPVPAAAAAAAAVAEAVGRTVVGAARDTMRRLGARGAEEEGEPCSWLFALRLMAESCK